MTLDEILTEYEGLWRQAALADRPQCRTTMTLTRTTTCAWMIADVGLQDEASLTMMPMWRCPLCVSHHVVMLSGILLHLNDVHHWTWDMLANKTRDVLQQGGVDLR